MDIEGAKRAKVLAHLREVYGEDRVAGVITFGTEQSKAALIDAARGLGLPPEDGQYFSSLVPKDRGQARTLEQCYYGDAEKDMKPVPLFVQEMDKNPMLWKVARKIGGLVSRIGSHAGGIIFVDEPFTDSTSLMRTPEGALITAFDLHTAERQSLIKYDLLSVEALDKIHVCLDLLVEDGLIEKKPTLKETYENTIGIYKLERTNPELWKMLWDRKILSVFQMEEASGIRGISLIKPKSVDELAVLNSVIRLMAPEKDMEQPLETWAKYRKNINLWYQEMRNQGLTEEEIQWLASQPSITDGICESQEGLMSLVQTPECGGFDLNFSDRLRKSIAKKNAKDYEAITKEYFEKTAEKGLSKNLCNYVWNTLIATSRGYSFVMELTHLTISSMGLYTNFLIKA